LGGDREERTAGGGYELALLEPRRKARRTRRERRRRARQEELELLGAKLHTMDVVEAAAWLVREAASGRRDAMPVAHANAHNLHLLRSRPELLAGLRTRGRLFLEGIGMKAVACTTGRLWRRDANGTDMAPLVFRRCAESGIPVYLLGGRPTVLDAAVERLRRRFPELVIAGAHHGYLTAPAERHVVRAIRASGAALLVQGRGCPFQEEFSLRRADELGVAVAWNVGGLFDFVAGRRPRAPFWMRRARMEWLFRMALEPRRLAPRSLVSFPALWWAAARTDVQGGAA
jgi:exopolysaccharide biosynthesis WecB/TagA/CpsF family protein